MFRFYKYDETGYTDFGNAIFSNLDNSHFDTSNDKVTIDEIEYRISSIKELCDSCNNSQNINNETMTTRPSHRTITTPGAKGTIPATNDHSDGSWLPTDLYNGEVLINTTDNIVYIRSGNEIRSWNLNPIVVNSPINFEFTDPDTVTVGQPARQILFHGSGFDQITGVDHGSIKYGIVISGFEVLNQGQISLIINASEANIGELPSVTLEIPFIISSGEITYAPMYIIAQNIPPGDSVITAVEPYGNEYFIAGEQQIRILGNNLNRTPQELSEVIASHQAVIFNGFIFTEDYILVDVNIGEELIGLEVNFMLSYQDGYTTEWFSVVLSESAPQP